MLTFVTVMVHCGDVRYVMVYCGTSVMVMVYCGDVCYGDVPYGAGVFSVI